jgi:glycosyltransferase involved in cell wall biosynthesis
MSQAQAIKENGISVVLGAYNRYWFLKRAIASIRQELIGIPHEIIVVDGGSTDGSLNWLIKQKDIISIVQHNRALPERRPWGYFMNLAFKCAQGKYICMLSDDCLVIPGAITNGYNYFENLLAQGRKVGAVAFRWRNWPTCKAYGVSTMFNQVYVDHGLYLNSALKEVGYLNEVDYDFYFGDIDLCMRLKAQGYLSLETQNSYIEHHAHANVKLREKNHIKYIEDMKKFAAKWVGKPDVECLPCTKFTGFEDNTQTIKKYYKFLYIVNRLTKPFKHPIKDLKQSWAKRVKR